MNFGDVESFAFHDGKVRLFLSRRKFQSIHYHVKVFNVVFVGERRVVLD